MDVAFQTGRCQGVEEAQAGKRHLLAVEWGYSLTKNVVSENQREEAKRGWTKTVG